MHPKGSDTFRGAYFMCKIIVFYNLMLKNAEKQNITALHKLVYSRVTKVLLSTLSTQLSTV